MAVREILKKGSLILKSKCSPVKTIDKEVLQLVEDLKDTLSTVEGVGLAAPQIGIRKRVILVDIGEDNAPILLINPKIVAKTGKVESEEGCLSIPGYYGFVERPRRIIVKGLNEKGIEVEYKAEGLLCNVFCHEIDHLDGILYTDRAYEINKDK